MSGGKNTFVKITNQEVYCEITNFRQENAKQHDEIMERLSNLTAKNEYEHEKIRGSINLVKATVGGVVAIVVAVASYVFLR